MPAPSLDIITLATSHAKSYASALQQSKSLSEWAHALSSHYLPGMISFTHGTVTKMDSDPATSLLLYLEKVNKTFGRDFRTVNIRAEKVSEQSAVVWMTFELRPKDGSEWIVWTNLYGFRVLGKEGDGMGTGRMGWEFTVADGEIEAFAKRGPGVFGGMEG